MQRALISVTDKSGVVEFARKLAGMGLELISTGGTARALREGGLAVQEISDFTGFPEMLEGRIKTLHPKVHGAILYRRQSREHCATIAEHGIKAIDLVVVNLYAFEETAARAAGQDGAFEELIENIDIGGPAMIRSAAKNFQDVAVVTSPRDYQAIAEEMSSSGGDLSMETKWRLARSAFAVTAAYDMAIASTLERVSPAGHHVHWEAPAEFPPNLRLAWRKVQDLRYGENPHQKAALYSDGSSSGLANARQLQGKELSYNNMVDLQAAWELAEDFEQPFCAIIKHTNPCGSATRADLNSAFLKAFECDPVSAFGGVIALNQPVNGAVANTIAGLRHNETALFIECIVAPSFDAAARERFARRKDLRLLEIAPAPPRPALRSISGGVLAQAPDVGTADASQFQTVSRRAPSDEEMRDLRFAWKVCKHVKSNAILYAKNEQGIGVGAGQMSRVDAARFGAVKALLPLKGSVAASDAFFPFADGVEEIAKTGATAIIQPGGSVRDAEVIAAADRHNMAMVLTGMRHFRH